MMTKIIKTINARDPNEKEFQQAVQEVIESVKPVLDQNPQYRQEAVLERIVEPERITTFRIPWLDDQGNVKVNRGFCIEMSSAIGSIAPRPISPQNNTLSGVNWKMKPKFPRAAISSSLQTR